MSVMYETNQAYGMHIRTPQYWGSWTLKLRALFILATINCEEKIKTNCDCHGH